MFTALFTIPLQMVCQLVVPGNNVTVDAPFAVDTMSPVNIPSLPIALELPKPTTGLREGYTAFPDIGVAYKYYPKSVTWNVARKECISDGSILAELDTFQKIGYAMRLKNDNSQYRLAVGIHRLFDNAEWTSLKTGQAVTTIPWAPTSNDENKEFECMALYFDGRGLAAEKCAEDYRFVCEIQLPLDLL